MKKNIFLTILLHTFLFLAKAQDWEFALELGDTNCEVVTNQILKFDNGYLISGYFNGDKIFEGENEIIGNEDGYFFLCLTDKFGNIKKTRGLAKDYIEYNHLFTTDSLENIYVAFSSNSLTLQIGDSSYINKGGSDAYLVKLNSDLSIVWSKSFSSPLDDVISALYTDMNGHVIVGGTSVNFTSKRTVIFAFNVSQEGALLWNNIAVNENGSSSITAIQTNENGSIIIGGNFSGSIKSGPFEFQSNTGDDGFFWRLDAVGNVVNLVRTENIYAFTNFHQHIYTVQQKGFFLGVILYINKYDINFQKKDTLEMAIGAILNPAMKYFTLQNSLQHDENGNLYLAAGFYADTFQWGIDKLYNQFTVIPEDELFPNFYSGIYVLKMDADLEPISGKLLNGNLNDRYQSFLITGEDEFVIAGDTDSDTLQLGNYAIYNSSERRIIYDFHNSRYYTRTPQAFIASYGEKLNTGIRDNAENLLKIRPNPAKETVIISGVTSKEKAYQLKVMNMTGQLVYAAKQRNWEGNAIDISVSEYPKGMYIILLETDGKVHSAKLLVQ